MDIHFLFHSFFLIFVIYLLNLGMVDRAKMDFIVMNRLDPTRSEQSLPNKYVVVLCYKMTLRHCVD